MKTAAQYAELAEDYLEKAGERESGSPREREYTATAQVYATLAVAASQYEILHGNPAELTLPPWSTEPCPAPDWSPEPPQRRCGHSWETDGLAPRHYANAVTRRSMHVCNRGKQHDGPHACMVVGCDA